MNFLHHNQIQKEIYNYISVTFSSFIYLRIFYMPNYQKAANQLFAFPQRKRLDNSTKSMRVTTQMGETFVHAGTKQECPPYQYYTVQQINTQKNYLTGKTRTEKQYDQLHNTSTSGRPQSAKIGKTQTIEQTNDSQPNQQYYTQSCTRDKLIKTRPRILIVPKQSQRSIDGIQTTMDSNYLSKYPVLRFQPEDLKKPYRNHSQIQNNFSITDGFIKDTWITTNQMHYSSVPSSYPLGYMSNQGISSMYSTYAHAGKFSKNPTIYRQYQGNK